MENILNKPTKVSPPHSLFSTEKEIISWLNSMHIKDYTLIPSKDFGFVVDVANSVCIKFKIGKLKVKFNTINGNFDCSEINLKNLYGCPETVVGDFEVSSNFLKSLIYGPKKVGYRYSCSANKLKNLIGAPDICEKFNCSYNNLTTLLGAPQKVSFFNCSGNKFLKSLEHCPKHIAFDFNALDTNINSLIDCPNFIGRHVSLNFFSDIKPGNYNAQLSLKDKSSIKLLNIFNLSYLLEGKLHRYNYTVNSYEVMKEHSIAQKIMNEKKELQKNIPKYSPPSSKNKDNNIIKKQKPSKI